MSIRCPGFTTWRTYKEMVSQIVTPTNLIFCTRLTTVLKDLPLQSLCKRRKKENEENAQAESLVSQENHVQKPDSIKKKLF
nr:hypothetical protein HmN_000173400 [Hymenolepis microstoma]